MSLSSIRFTPQVSQPSAQNKRTHANALLGPLFAGSAEFATHCSKPSYAQQVLKSEQNAQHLFMLA